METGEFLTRWTVRLALILYVLALAVRIRAAGRRRWLNLARDFWTAGSLVFLTHVACAFHFYHDWSHAAAYAATARDTARLTGWTWGGGIYGNYLFTALWIADAGWWWLDGRSYLSRSRWVEWGVQGYLGFIAFNATVVFETGVVRWVGMGACLFLIGLLANTFYSQNMFDRLRLDRVH